MCGALLPLISPTSQIFGAPLVSLYLTQSCGLSGSVPGCLRAFPHMSRPLGSSSEPSGDLPNFICSCQPPNLTRFHFGEDKCFYLYMHSHGQKHLFKGLKKNSVEEKPSSSVQCFLLNTHWTTTLTATFINRINTQLLTMVLLLLWKSNKKRPSKHPNQSRKTKLSRISSGFM